MQFRSVRASFLISIQALYDYKKYETSDSSSILDISIQALYDYKKVQKQCTNSILLFQFKHCTIISPTLPGKTVKVNISIQALYDYKCSLGISKGSDLEISIQALYDYKYIGDTLVDVVFGFQFKHCTIIRANDAAASFDLLDFNSSIVRL